MNRLDKLKLEKTFKELDFIKSDLEYKSELLSDLEVEFFEHVNVMLKNNPELKESYENKQTAIFDEQMQEKMQEIQDLRSEDLKNFGLDEDSETETDSETDSETDIDDVEEKIEKKDEKYKKIKNLYRIIAKKTHPDKVQDLNLNSIYVDATEAYNKNDIYTIYSICTKLGIDYEIELGDLDTIKSSITSVKVQVNLIEGSYPWQWFNGDNTLKERLALAYIKQRILS